MPLDKFVINLHFVRHGEMLYLFDDMAKNGVSAEVASTSAAGTTQIIGASGSSVKEDHVDQLLDKEDGKIYRKRNEQL